MRHLFVLVLLLLAPQAPVQAFVDPQRLLASGALPAPPPADSLADRADLDAVLLVQDLRTPALEEEARADADLTPLQWAQARLGRRLSSAEAAFFEEARAGMTRTIDIAKASGAQRPRPAARDPRVRPSLSIEGHGSNSWPSGRAAATQSWAGILADIEPARAEALAAAAHRSGDLRVIGGVHYPSDVIAGRMLAVRFLADLRATPDYRERLQALRGSR